MLKLTRGRRLLRTQDGRLGTAPEEVREGDEIGLFSGLQLPMIIRRADNGECSRFVGQRMFQAYCLERYGRQAVHHWVRLSSYEERPRVFGTQAVR